MKKLLKNQMAVFAVGMCYCSGLANASSSVVYNYTGESYGGLGMGISVSDYTGPALVGEFVMTSTTPGYTTPLYTYCTDVNEWLQNTYTYTPTPITSATGASPLWISGGGKNAANVWYNNHNNTSDATQNAGLQLAIWELLYNNVTTTISYSTFFDAANNGFFLTDTSDANAVAAASDAADFINNLGSQPDNSGKVDWLAPTDANGQIGGSQGLLTVNPGTSSPPHTVPDSTPSLELLGLTAATLMLFRKNMDFGSKA